MEWIRRGLRFECQPDCGRCCSRSVREGSVFVEPDDVDRLAAFLSATSRAFARDYTVDEDGDLVLKMQDNGDCCFLHDGKCTVYDARPLQCRVYPFLPLDGYTPIESSYTWRYEKRFCPGIGKGRLYSKAEIARIARGRASADGFEE